MTVQTQAAEHDTTGDERRLRLGLAWNFPITDKDPRALRRLYAEIVDAIVYAEDLGIDSVWLAQHHFDGQLGGLPSPLLLLALAAARTSRITLGTGIIILPLEDPIRLAEDAAVLDLIADGRLHLGLATGGANAGAFAALGLDPANRRALFDRNLERLRQALTGQSLVTGQDGPRLSPPGGGLDARIWQAATTVDWAQAAAQAGDGIQLGSFVDPAGTGQRPKADAYLREWDKIGRSEAPRVALFRFLYLGDTRRAVIERTEPDLGPKLEQLGKVAGEHGNAAISRYTVRDYLENIAFYGNPDDIAQQFRDDPTNPTETATDFVANFNNAREFDAGLLQVQLQALAREIGPRVGWRPAR